MPPTGIYNVFELSTGSVVGLTTTALITTNTSPITPTSANLMAGQNSNDTGTILAIPAGRTWYGTVGLSATVVSSSALAVAAAPNLVGNSAIVNSSTLPVIKMTVPPSSALAPNSMSQVAVIPGMYLLASSSGTGALAVAFGGAAAASGWATGVLLSTS